MKTSFGFINMKDLKNNRLNLGSIIDYAPDKNGKLHSICISVYDYPEGFLFNYESEQKRNTVLQSLDKLLINTK